MNRLLTGGAWLLLALTASAPAEPASPDETRADFEAMAFALPTLALDPVLHGPAEPHAGPNFTGETEAGDGILCQLAGATYRKEDLVALRSHDNPRVRTLAAVALFERDDPSVLPTLLPLCADLAPTFDADRPAASSLLNKNNGPNPRRGQTVGSVVEAMLNVYLRSAGFTHGVQPKSAPGFEQYWAARRERAYCAGWFAVQLDRAGHGIVPTPPECAAAIRAVRRRIDAAPADERALALLWLRGQPGGDRLATDGEIVEAARVFGKPGLFGLLRGRCPTDDPDAQPGGFNDWLFRRMQRFVLAHAADLFGPEDADEILACGLRTDNAPVAAECVVAAAELRPREAVAILRAAMERFNDRRDARQRTLLAAELCRVGGEAERVFVLEWFYQAPAKWEIELARVSFIEQVSTGAHGRETLAAVIRDYRFGSVGWEVMRQAARAVGAWSPSPVVADGEFTKFYWKTNDLKPEWVRKLRASIPHWLEEPAGKENWQQKAAGF